MRHASGLSAPFVARLSGWACRLASSLLGEILPSLALLCHIAETRTVRDRCSRLENGRISRRDHEDLTRRSLSARRAPWEGAFATAGLRPATRRWRDLQIQAAVDRAPFVVVDLSTSGRAQRDVANARRSASSASSARDPDMARAMPGSTRPGRASSPRSDKEVLVACIGHFYSAAST